MNYIASYIGCVMKVAVHGYHAGKAWLCICVGVEPPFLKSWIRNCEVLSGVPQGTMLAPLLFLLYINDLPACVHNRIKLYADDVLLYSNINSVTDCIALQQDLDSLVEWSHSWQLNDLFNPQKCDF